MSGRSAACCSGLPHTVISKEGMTLGEVLSHYMWGNAQGVAHSRNKHHFPEKNIPLWWDVYFRTARRALPDIKHH